ncbi:hypothetical protein DFJ67_8242 [Asanoa ferruginea]|uniref:Uncharacterized protein n=1 Tax=Asanoa ferruginea TaxID=53367 RepID=A0A3D9ZYQ1_9ACTN|nr:hypothetical protein [Asanoa ferruginea]REG02150.1 hypothetical protein DFJ67_8242 [Asanoa ferruginea]GIF48553.1 hypothetical protein Afe04nite_30920 [Asanoa ferruginea]
MTTWRGLRKELVGAWRSVQYDLARLRPRRRSDGEETTELIFPEHARPPRRLAATGAFAVASLAGAAATYFAVVSGLGALLETDASAAESPKPVIAGAAGTGQRSSPDADEKPTVRIARQGGPLTVAGRQAGAGGAGSSDTRGGVPGDLGGPPGPVRHPGGAVPEESEEPPGNPPTQPPTPTPTTDPTESPSATSSPDPSVSADPNGDDGHDEGRRRHRHHRPDQDEGA